MRVAFHTLGCKVNQYETEGLKEKFRLSGHQVVDEKDFADAYIVNTCTVTHLADRKSRQYIRRMKKINPEAIIAVTGCYAQVSPDEVTKINDVDIIIGSEGKGRLIDLVEQYAQSGVRTEAVNPSTDFHTFDEQGLVTSMESRTRAYVKVQEGCNRFCSYCVIPYARGNVRSRKASLVVKEAQNLISSGFSEIILTGINTALYGCEKGYECDIPSAEMQNIHGIEILISLLDKLPGDFRIRLSSLEPTVVDADYAERLLHYPKLCHHLHLSVQSGSNKIMRLMNRHYTMDKYYEIVDRLRKADPQYGISTDIIVGFPGETEEDFRDSLAACRRAEFCKVHAFQYSKRKFTKASDMPGQVPPSVKKQRSRLLIREGEKVLADFLTKNIGTVRTVIFEEEDESGRLISGYSDNYIRIYASNRKGLLGKIVYVKMTELHEDGLFGEILN